MVVRCMLHQTSRSGMKGIRAGVVASCLGRRHTYYVLVVLALIHVGAIFGWFYWQQNEQEAADGIQVFAYYQAQIANNTAEVCHLPDVDPWDESILQYIFPAKPINCKARQVQGLTRIDDMGCLLLDGAALKRNGFGMTDLTCDFQEFGREEGSDDTLHYFVTRRLTADIPAILNQSDFVTVNCKNFLRINKYSNVHIHYRPATNKQAALKNADAPNVIVFGIDGMSRLNFLRKLPKTYKYLTETLGSEVMKGYVKVGDNTYPNVGAMLTGKQMWGAEMTKFYEKNQGYYDSWPIIWKDFAAKGYKTFFAEGWLAEYNTFNFLSHGFKKQPTDAYLRPFWLHLENTPMFKYSSNLCYDTVPKFQYVLQYARQFLDAHASSQPFFQFLWISELSHEYINQVEAGDQMFLEFFRGIFRAGYLKNTILLVVSDHGHRYDKIRTTLVGRIEERMPFLSIALPEGMKIQYPKVLANLKGNKNRLTSHFDVHSTLKDVLTFPLSLNATESTGLFSSVVPKLRTCQDAGVPENYCPCQIEAPVNTSDESIISAGHALVKHTNHLLSTHHDICETLFLKRVMSAQVVLPNKDIIKTEDTSRGYMTWWQSPRSSIAIHFIIVLQVAPSNAILESTVKYDTNRRSYKVVHEVSRINRYGNQSSCIKHATLRKFCYCKL